MELLNTKLDAVNLCLAGIGREPVSSLATPDLDAAMAVASIDQMSLEIQNNGGRGWWFNQEAGWRITPNNAGEVRVPNNTLSILEARASFYDQGNRLAVRGNRVYDTDNHTFDLSESLDKGGAIEFTLLLLLPYEDLPATARSAISWAARRLFSDDTVGDPNQTQRELQNESRAMAMLQAEDTRARRRNYLKDNDRIRTKVGLIGGFNNMYR